MNIITDFMQVFRHNLMQIPLKTNGCSVLKYIVLNFSTLRAIFLTPAENLKLKFFNVVVAFSGSISCYDSIYTYLWYFLVNLEHYYFLSWLHSYFQVSCFHILVDEACRVFFCFLFILILKYV